MQKESEEVNIDEFKSLSRDTYKIDGELVDFKVFTEEKKKREEQEKTEKPGKFTKWLMEIRRR